MKILPVICFARLVSAILFVSACFDVALAQQAELKPDISGFWELRFDSKSIPRAALVPKVTAKEIEAHRESDLMAIRWCNYLGMPAVMEQPPLDIRQGRIEVAIIVEPVSVARHIYTDGRSHVSMDTFDPTTNGQSIGRWEGDTFVVDTIGFAPDRGIISIPGGGYRTADSHLTERYRLLNGGKQLSVTFTWEDPNVFAKPHTYEFRYYRAPKDTNARILTCDPFDEDRARFLTQPLRNP
jgi:hypothetical protein